MAGDDLHTAATNARRSYDVTDLVEMARGQVLITATYNRRFYLFIYFIYFFSTSEIGEEGKVKLRAGAGGAGGGGETVDSAIELSPWHL